MVTDTGTNANLYCISLESFDVIASVEGFAPEGENVHSVRFDGTAAYVCTAVSTKVQVLDPVFFFDLSDLNNITYKDTGTIEGMSTSLIHYGDGYLIGIGNGVYNGNDSREVLKIEVYKENGDVVVPICKYDLMPVQFSDEYKAY